MKRRLEAKLETLAASEKKDKTLTFEELGIDRLFVDEAHKFKNLFYVTKMTRVWCENYFPREFRKPSRASGTPSRAFGF